VEQAAGRKEMVGVSGVHTGQEATRVRHRGPNRPVKTYDCILFFNELDLLELRLKTLWDVVDHFVIVEAPWTFSGKPKPLYFKESHREFQRWLKKIKHLQLSGEIPTENPWLREWASRNAMVEGFLDADQDDWIFQSDCDEIWRPELRDVEPDDKIVTYEQFHCFYYMNTPRVPEHKWRGTRRCRFRDWPGGQKLRSRVGKAIPDGGWHFSFLGDENMASAKLSAYSHSELDTPERNDKDKIREYIRDGIDLTKPGEATYEPVPVDDTFPKPVVEDPQRWAKYIKSHPA